MLVILLFLGACVVDFTLGGVLMMGLTGIIFPVFGHAGLSFWNSGLVAILFGWLFLGQMLLSRSTKD